MATVQQTLCIAADDDLHHPQGAIPSLEGLHLLSSIIPKATNPVSTVTAVPISKPPSQQTSLTPVVTKESIFEKLRHLQFTSKLNLVADFHPEFTNLDEKKTYDGKMTELTKYFHDNAPLWVHEGTPTVGMFLVSVTGSAAAKATPYICVKGLRTHKQVEYFHKRLSTRSARATYHPLRLCYDTSFLSRLAAQDNYQLQIEPSDCTLCGHLLRTRIGPQIQISTIGGLIEVDGQLLALTTAHKPEDTRALEDIQQSLDTVDPDDFDDDVEQALVVDEHNWKHSPGGDMQPDSGSHHLSTRSIHPGADNWAKVGEPIAEGDDWRLHHIGDALCRPNVALTALGKFYILRPGEPPLRRQIVSIITGTSGAISGTLLSNLFHLKLDLKKPFMTCLIVELEQGAALRKGDSGSWVVDPEDNCTLGHIIACSEGFAYMIPIARIFEDINAVLAPSKPASLPAPFNVLADLAHHFYSSAEKDGGLADRFATEALSNLQNDGFPKILERDLTMEDLRGLKSMICIAGKDIVQGLGDPQKWVFDHFSDIAGLASTGELISLLGEIQRPAIDTQALQSRKNLHPELRSLPIDSTDAQGASKEGQREPAEVVIEKECARDRSHPSKCVGDSVRDKDGDYSPQETISSPSPNSILKRVGSLVYQHGLPLFMLLLIAGSIVGASAVAMVVVTHVDRSLKSQDLVTHGSVGGGILAAIYFGYIIALYAIRQRGTTVGSIFLGIVILPFSSTFVVTVVLSQRILHRQRPISLFVAAAAAGAPYCGDLAWLVIQVLKLSERPHYNIPDHGWYQLFALVGIGYDALAGYTFARVADNRGSHVCDPKAAAAAAAVYGAITHSVRGLAVEILRRFRYGSIPPAIFRSLYYET